MENDSVRYSRAGDAFHYRWAARRCLRMIYPNSPITRIVIEGSKEKELAGEYVIDVAEYSESLDGNSKEIEYFQLKHTITRKNDPFDLSDLKVTIQGFSKRFLEQVQLERKPRESTKVTFTIVTNRPINEKFKESIKTIGNGTKILYKSGNAKNKRIVDTLKRYTNLKGKLLKNFCASLRFVDEEGDYNVQRYKLHSDISHLLAGTVDNPKIDSIITMVQDRVLQPPSKRHILREDVYQRLGVSSERDLFPAPPIFEQVNKLIQREQHSILLENIIETSKPIIIHAAGGVGKTVVALQIANSLPDGSLGIVYDCFGAGGYRKRSEPRHRHRDALVQIINELTAQGLCDPLIVTDTVREDEILRKFLIRLKNAITSLRKINNNAILVVFIDAADNAEMAAKEYGDTCFIHELLRENIPEGCRLVALCRTERINLLQATSNVLKVELKSFSKDETLNHLIMNIPDATVEDALEFHRLTNGNPRVQVNALSIGSNSILKVLFSLGPSGTTVEKQIQAQLDSIIPSVKEKYPIDYQHHINAICRGLAILPPFIPLAILATAADVDEATVNSFVSDIGRPLWISETSVQFRDEPTETWFRENFAATKEQINEYITRIKPLAHQSPYVAEALPPLLLQSEMYAELIDLALSDNFLPEDSPIDKRNIRLFRLQFAFKAALKVKNYAAAIKLAMRAGEEVAGNERQLSLLRNNVDLIAPLQSEQRVRELAFKRKLSSSWNGSENVYSAALLSSVNEFKGEARGYLRAAINWLSIYFKERKEKKEETFDQELQDEDIVELTFAFYNLYELNKCIDFILSWRPPEVIYRITRQFIKRLVDAGNFETISKISKVASRNQYLMVALTHELLEVGRFPNIASMNTTLDLLATKRIRIAKPSYRYNDTTATSILSFLEACAAKNLSKQQILRTLKYYFPIRAPRWVHENHQEKERNNYLRASALRSILFNNQKPNLDTLLPKEFIKKEHKQQHEQEIRQFKEVIGGLLPWYIVRTLVLVNNSIDLFHEMNIASKASGDSRLYRWSDSDFISSEIARICIDILMFSKIDSIQTNKFYNEYLKAKLQLDINSLLKAVRIAYRLEHLKGIRNDLVESANDFISSASGIDPETKAGWNINLARAVMPICKEDAKTYFDYAIEAVSRFGDEVLQRWKAVTALAGRSVVGGHSGHETAYRFMRCAELVGDNMDRERHWDRNQAISLCAKLSPVSALATLSRWRDRDIGWFEDLLPALAEEMVSSGYLSPILGWSLSPFFESKKLAEFAIVCIRKESSHINRQYILDMVIRDLRMRETEVENWQKLKLTAEQYSLKNSELDGITSFHQQNPKIKKEEYPYIHQSNKEKPNTINWSEIFHGLDLTTSSGISQVMDRYKASLAEYSNAFTLWKEMFGLIEEGDILKFIRALTTAESVDLNDIKQALYLLPPAWKLKISVKQNWMKILETIAQRFAIELTNYYSLKYFLEYIGEGEDSIPFIRMGLFNGLSNNSDLIDANTFFYFAEMAASFVSPQQASELLNYSLNRFELHIDNDYADGNWSNWLIPPDDMSTAFAGFLWAALGSPCSQIRWQAAHCVRRLANANLHREINSLIYWMEKYEVGAFGSKNFPFYNLHARQYLLIALARISLDNPQILIHHHGVFYKHAIKSIQHILIQKFSAEVALNIEKSFPGTYSNEEIMLLGMVGVSPFPKQDMRNNREQIYDNKNEVEDDRNELKFYHGYDFDRYWFEPLGRVFGISGKQVEKLATNVIKIDWHINNDGSYKCDPRSNIWQAHRNERETWHSHGEYPRTDNLSFYQSYHSMLTVAAQLLQQMPIIKLNDWEEDEWVYWLKRHLLTRTDGYWLADRRDQVPLIRRNWLFEKVGEKWRYEITDDDFIDGLIIDQSGKPWLTVSGSWENGDNDRQEDYSVSSSLVSCTTAQSLLHALSTCSDSRDYSLPNYHEEEIEFDLSPFRLWGWIKQKYSEHRLDEYDQLAGNISYPPYQIGDSILEQFKLLFDKEQRKWWMKGSEDPCIVCEIWSSDRPEKEKDPLRSGIRMSASLDFLTALCKIQQCSLIFEVQISHRFKNKYYSKDNDETKYKPPQSKIYILTPDGKLCDERKYYKLRENNSKGAKFRSRS